MDRKPPELSAMELQVLLAYANGLDRGEIARKLRRTTNTIDAHASEVCRKLHAGTIAQAVFRAADQSMIMSDAAGSAVYVNLTPRWDPDRLDVQILIARGKPISDPQMRLRAVAYLRSQPAARRPTIAEIATMIGCTRRTVESYITRLSRADGRDRNAKTRKVAA